MAGVGVDLCVVERVVEVVEVVVVGVVVVRVVLGFAELPANTGLDGDCVIYEEVVVAERVVVVVVVVGGWWEYGVVVDGVVGAVVVEKRRGDDAIHLLEIKKVEIKFKLLAGKGNLQKNKNR